MNANQKKNNSTKDNFSPTKKTTKRIPTEFKRLHNWRELLLDSEKEEEERRKRKTAETSAIKATVDWGITKTEPQEEPLEKTPEQQKNKTGTDTDNEPSSSTGERRSQRNRKAPQYYGEAVMICGVENDKAEEREIIKISSSDDSLR